MEDSFSESTQPRNTHTVILPEPGKLSLAIKEGRLLPSIKEIKEGRLLPSCLLFPCLKGHELVRNRQINHA